MGSSDYDKKNDPSCEGCTSPSRPLDFIRKIVMDDLASGKWGGQVVTRFPPEPNGYLHIGHAKSICLNFGIAAEFGGRCHLRFDDTNPTKEDVEYVEAIKEDVRWLGWDWGEHLYFASDYFDKMYEFAVQLIKKGKAYVCDLSPEQVREMRGTLTEPGIPSPYRNRSIEENLDLFERMRAGEFEEGSRTLRAKIDMASPNLNLRDPVLYRIIKAPHHRTGNKWCIYPMYDFAHPISDSPRGNHPLHLHSRVRGSPPALRLGVGGARHPSLAADRIRTAESDVHRHEQAQAPPACAGRLRAGMG